MQQRDIRSFLAMTRGQKTETRVKETPRRWKCYDSKILITLLIIYPVLTFLISAQTHNSFFPHKLGNKWVYASFEPSTGMRDTTTGEVLKDSLLANGNYLVELSHLGWYVIDTNGIVYGYPDTNLVVRLWDFTAPIKSWWKYSPDITIEVDTFFSAKIFGIETTVVVFNGWWGDINNPNGRSLFGVNYFAERFGLVQSDSYEAFYKTEYLIGAVIDSTRYGTLTTILPSVEHPVLASLKQNYPNPFSSVTAINFSLASHSMVSLMIYNIYGNLVRTLFAKDGLSAGERISFWDGRNDKGKKVANGIYFYQLQGNDFSITRKAYLYR